MRHLIIGNGVAGITAAQNIRRLDPNCQITVVTEEAYPFYSRPGLMYHMMGTLKEWDLCIAKNDGFYQEIGAEIKRARALRVARDSDSVELETGERIEFDRMLLATGSRSRALDVPGADLEGIHVMYSLTDAKRIMSETRKGLNAVIVGGGLLGVELAEVWRHHGLHVASLVLEPWYFQKALSEPQGRIVENAIRKHGCDLVLGEEAAEFKGDGRVAKVVAKSGREFDADIVGITVGVTPNTELAEASGIACDKGVLTDTCLRTNRPNVFAAGDCAEIRSTGSEDSFMEHLWYSADRQARIAALNMCGEARPYDPGIFYNSAKFFDVDYVSIGSGRYPDDDQQDETLVSRNGRAARRFITQNGVVTGITSVGANERADLLMGMVRDGVSLEDARKRLGGWAWPR